MENCGEFRNISLEDVREQYKELNSLTDEEIIAKLEFYYHLADILISDYLKEKKE